MTEEKKELLDRINDLITKKKNELFKLIPDIHEIDDGIIIRSFKNWEIYSDNHNVKYKKINNHNNTNEIVILYYLPKDSILEINKKNHIGNITCLSGEVEITHFNDTHFLNSYNKLLLNSYQFQCKSIKNSYIISTSNEHLTT